MKLYSIRNRMLGEQDDQAEEQKNVRVSGIALLVIAVLLILTTALITFLICRNNYRSRLEKERAYTVVFPSGTDPFKVSKFQDIVNFINSQFALDYTDDKLIEGAITGYVKALEDRYSYYIEPGDFEEYNEFITGVYSGAGIRTQYQEGGMVVTDVVDGTPAKSAGIAVGELVTYVNGIKVEESAASQIASILSQEGVIVKLTIEGLDGKTREVELKTVTINRETVSGIGYEDGVYYIRIRQFDSDTGSEFEKTVRSAKESGMKALVLDIRNNPGGYERQADQVADLLLGEGVIAYLESRNGERTVAASSDADEIDVPVILLVNGNTASAAELLTGAFRDFGKGRIIGQRTYGKAIGQVSRSYTDDGSGIVITVATYYTPSGECIHNKGIAPDIEIALPDAYANLTPEKIPAGEDTQLEKAFELIRQEIAG